MNKLTIIGNLTKDPEFRSTATGLTVCTFTVAVNRKRTPDAQPEAEFFRVTAWRQLGENCAKYLRKGRKVCVIGPVSVNTYKGQDGQTRASLEVTAEDVEFLTPKGEQEEKPLYQAKKERDQNEKETAYQKAEREAIQKEKEYVNVETDDLPFE